MPQSIPQGTKNTRNIATPGGIHVTVPGVSTLPFTPTRQHLGRSGIGPDSPHFLALNDRLSVLRAARTIHKSPAYVMDFVNRGLLKAYKTGGSVERPRLAVDLSDLLAVIDQETLYVPPALVGRRLPRPRQIGKLLHPLAAAF